MLAGCLFSIARLLIRLAFSRFFCGEPQIHDCGKKGYTKKVLVQSVDVKKGKHCTDKICVS